MLRICLIVITAFLVVISPRLASLTFFANSWLVDNPWFFAAFWPGVLLLGLLFERVRYKAELSAPPGPDWLATEERTVDESGTVRVWYNPRSGARAYVREPNGHSP